MSKDINWDNVVSAVATNEGLVVQEKRADGTLGATRTLYSFSPPILQQQGQRMSFDLVKLYIDGHYAGGAIYESAAQYIKNMAALIAQIQGVGPTITWTK